MAHWSLRLLLLLAAASSSLANASPAAPSSWWECYNFQRACESDGSICTYKFAVTQGPFPDVDPTYCRFDISAKPGVTAAETSFTDVACDDAQQLHVSGGWDQVGQFITIVVTNTQAGQLAYFGFTEDEMADGKMAGLKESPPFPVAKSFPRQSDSVNASNPEPDPQQHQRLFTLSEVNRHIETSNNTVFMDMVVDENVFGAFGFCHLVVPITEGTDPRYASWYNEPCIEGGWRVSWGYDADKDSAVLTLATSGGGINVWFGWDHVNDSEHLGSAGPNPAVPQ